ncbi:4253_t:CDS:1 [Acaulospora morrowiae]|uniref:4253_t:CDS:1 n=1 Tax=Acaulospora morrowiae TaxID=94023 RepID=A0A9N9HMJ5_9GLOM|nr:4253_t:CDS:1 [Acaulospora morrowiae]
MIENNKQIDNITIELPFPPSVDLINLITKGSAGKKLARTPNAFLIYRKVFVETARHNGVSLPMTNISTLASKRWANESDLVKAAYKVIARDALLLRNDVFPKHGKRKRIDRWNLVTFDQFLSERQKKSQCPVVKKAANTSLPKLSSLPSQNNTENSMNDCSIQCMTSLMDTLSSDVSRLVLDELELDILTKSRQYNHDSKRENHIDAIMTSYLQTRKITPLYSDKPDSIKCCQCITFQNEINLVFPRAQNQIDAVNSVVTSNEQIDIDYTNSAFLTKPNNSSLQM